MHQNTGLFEKNCQKYIMIKIFFKNPLTTHPGVGYNDGRERPDPLPAG
jgi:hypothetical protein